MTPESAVDQKLATKAQVTKLTRLAAKFGLGAPKSDLTSLEAQDALHGLETLNRWQEREDRGTKMPPPPHDAAMQPGKTLDNWAAGRPRQP